MHKKIRVKTVKSIWKCYFKNCPFCGYSGGGWKDSGECPICGETS